MDMKAPKALGSSEDLGHGGGELDPGVPFQFELPASRLGEFVILGAAIVFRSTPLRFDPAAALESMECRVEGALLDVEDIAGDLLDALGDGPAVQRLKDESLKDEKVESALRQIDATLFGHARIPLLLLQGG
jgi:hypothetical protein